MQNIIFNVNGQIIGGPEAAQKARVSVMDRGYLYGDSLYEVLRTYDGKLFGVTEHLDRLEKSAQLCRMTIGQPLETLRDQMQRTLEAFQAQSSSTKQETYLRIIVSRGEGKIGFGLSCLTTPTLYVMIAQPLEEPSAAHISKGLHLQISKRIRNSTRALDPAMKSGNYLNSLLAYLEAASENYDDALLCNDQGHLTEGTTFNLFYARRGILATPPLEIGILDGITRRRVIDLARSLGLDVREVRFPPQRLYEADEVFVTSTIREVCPVTRINKAGIRNGKPGSLTLKLREAFQREVRNELKSAGGAK